MRPTAADPQHAIDPNVPSSSAEAEPFSSSIKPQVTGLILALATITFFVIANLPFQYVQAEADWFGTFELDGMNSVSRHGLLPRSAGWPFSYSIRYQHAGLDQQRYWSTLALIANSLLAVATAGAVFGYLRLRHKRIERSTNSRRTRLFFDLGIGAAMLAVPTLIFGISYRTTIQHKRLAEQISKYGNAQLSVWVPKAMVDHVPPGIRKLFFRLRQVHALSLPTELERQTVAVDTLVGLGSYRGNLNTASLHRLSDHVHFNELAIDRQELSEQDMDAIAALPWLARLQLSSTNLNSDLLRKLDRLRLLEVNLSGTPLRLADLGRPDWADTVLQLRLPRPPQGVADTLKLEHWPNLTRLSVRRAGRDANPEPLELILSDLPELEMVQLDRLQKHRVVLRNLPRLASFEETIDDLQILLSSSDRLPGLAWVSEWDIDNTPSLTRLTAFGRDLKSISLKRVPNLKSLSIGSYLTTVHGGCELQGVDAECCQQWINELGQRDGPSTLNLTMLPLAGIDLTPLSNNKRIRRLLMSDTGVEFAQLRGLARMQQLERLEIRSCRVESPELEYLLGQFPNLRQLGIDGTPLTEINLNSGLALRRLDLPTLPLLQRLTLKRLPLLTTFFRIGPNIRHLKIRDAAALRGLAVEAPWREEFEVGELRDLSWFAAGGAALNDEIVDVLLRCPKLDDLTLAYTSVSRQKLRELGQFNGLTVLAVPGANVDDEIVESWLSLEKLWEVNLDDTQVGDLTIGWLSGQKSLRRVSLNRVPLDDDAAVMLSQLRQLSQLCLAHVDIPLKYLKPLLVAGNLESLDLSGRPLDAELRQLLNCPHNLRHLVMHDSEIDPEALLGILTDHSEEGEELYVDVGQLPEAIDNRIAAELHRRGFRVRRDFVRGWQSAFRGMRLISLSEDETSSNRQRLRHDQPASASQSKLRQTIPITMPPTMARIDTEPFRQVHLRMSKAPTPNQCPSDSP